MVFNIRNMPGFAATIESEESQVYFGGRQGQTQLSEKPIVVGSDAIDVGNIPETTLRGGLIMILDNGLYYPLGQAGKFGPIQGVLPFTLDVFIYPGLLEERWCQLFISGLLKTEEIIDAGRAEFNALTALGFILDDSGMGGTISRGFLQTVQVDDSDFIAAKQHYSSMIVVDNPVTLRTVTLPPIEDNGYLSVMLGAAGGTIQSIEGGNMIDAGIATANNITTSGLKMLEFNVVTIGSTLAWAAIGGDAT